MNRYVVLDTNCLLQSLSRRSTYYRVWEDFILGRYTLCVSNEILEEYEEIIASHMSTVAAKIALETILRATNVLRVDAQFRFGLITVDPDDNKFVDCAIVANADYIVSEDSHFNALRAVPFPHVEVKRLQEFYDELMMSETINT
ncbi:MAG: putative toxin-antitoxin system toxin component, PIN family [Prevotella sp.]|nr:putative toxin-antitoxin system toxin component, PIN family [Prevotella sp.]MBR1462010.1 putative toxin-antitoxin system toxin component, PIN family [Prevotella sp.]